MYMYMYHTECMLINFSRENKRKRIGHTSSRTCMGTPPLIKIHIQTYDHCTITYLMKIRTYLPAKVHVPAS